MDFQSAMETFAEAWAAANAGSQTQALALTRPKSPPPQLKGADLIQQQHHHQHQHHQHLLQQHAQHSPQLSPVQPISLATSSSSNGRSDSDEPSRGPPDAVSPSSMLHRTKLTSTPHQSSSVNYTAHHQAAAIELAARQSQAMAESAAAASLFQHSHNNNNSTTNNNNSSGGGGSGSGAAVNLKVMRSSASPVPTENGLTAAATSSYRASSDTPQTPPASDRRDLHLSSMNAKSLPLHCVVESISSMQASLSLDGRSPWRRRPNIETDSYVIVPAATLFADIVATALQRLGYSPEITSTARGTIIIKNWKPLPIEKISDSHVVSAGDILGELTSVVTLRIVILRAKPAALTEIKDKLLKLLVIQSHAVLRSTGCPLDEITLSQICRNYQSSFPFCTEISDEMRHKFDQWWTNQLTPQASAITPKLLPFVSPQPPKSEFSPSSLHMHSSRESLLDVPTSHHHPSAGGGPMPHHNMVVHPALQRVHSQYPSQKTRMRTSFDPELELPKLQRWFADNPHPSRQQIQTYVIQLNSLESRRGRKPLDVNNVVYWFKNARAAQKRAELRGQGMNNGFGGPPSDMMMSHSEYIKSPMSLKSDDIDNISQHSDDMDDDMDHRPMSPQLPLSLTTHERHRFASAAASSAGAAAATNNNNDDTNHLLHHPVTIKSELRRSRSPGAALSHPSASHNGSTEHINALGEPNDPATDTDDNIEQHSSSLKGSPHSEDLDMESDINPLDEFRSPSLDAKRNLPFPMVPNSMFSHSIMYMSHYIPQMGQQPQHHGGIGGGGGGGGPNTPNMSPQSMSQAAALNMAALSSDERRKRNRTFIDPVTEVPKLEQWFAMNTHPSHNLILKYTEDLNRMPYRQKFPRLESKNVQFWFKNRRAKCKRLKMSLYDPSQLSSMGAMHMVNETDSSCCDNMSML